MMPPNLTEEELLRRMIVWLETDENDDKAIPDWFAPVTEGDDCEDQ